MKLNNFCITSKTSLINCLNLFKKNHVGEAIVINSSNKMLGIIAEADIRNLIIQGFGINDKIGDKYNKNPILIKDKFTDENKINLLSNPEFQKKDPKIIPIIDKKNKLKDLLICDEMRLISDIKSVKPKKSIKKVLIIGGAGYIGSLLTEILIKNNYKTIVFDKFIYSFDSLTKMRKNNNLKIIKSDTRDIAALYMAIKDADAVVHLGELVGDPMCSIDPDLTYSINYLATKNICNICKDLGVNNFLYVSSCSVYGSQTNFGDLVEQSSLNPQSIYAKLKIFCEKAILEAKSKNFKPCILRLGTVFGISHRPRFDLVINILTANAFKNKRITINGGNQWRPFVHVYDVANTINIIINKNFKNCSGEIFNISSFNMKISSISDYLKKIINKLKIKTLVNNLDKRNYQVNSTKAIKAGIFNPKRKLEDGIDEMINFLKKRKNFDYKNKKYINYLNIDQF